MEPFVIDINVNISVELHSVTILVVPIAFKVSKPLEIESIPHAGFTVQPMILPLFLEHWYVATSLEHTGLGPTSRVD